MIEKVWALLGLTGLVVENEEGSEVAGGSSSEKRVWVWDISAGVLVDFRERPDDFLRPSDSFCLSGLILVEGFRGVLSLTGSEVVGGGVGGG